MLGYMIPSTPEIDPVQDQVAHAAACALTIDDMGKIHTNTGDADNQAVTMPAAKDVAGCKFRYALTVAQTVTFEPAGATEKLYVDGSGVANKHAVIAGVIGNFVDWYSNGEVWICTARYGVITKEA